MIIVLIIMLLLLQHVVCFTCLPAIRLFIKTWEILFFSLDNDCSACCTQGGKTVADVSLPKC